MTSSGMMQYVEWLNNLHLPPLSSPADSLCLDMSLEWMSWLLPIEFSLRNHLITGEDPQGGPMLTKDSDAMHLLDAHIGLDWNSL